MTQNTPKPTCLAEGRMEGKHLAYYLAAANAQFWDEHWKSYLSPAIYQTTEMGVLDPYEAPFTRYLPKTGKIIKASCGLAQYVLALNKRVYEVEGVDFNTKTVNAVRALRLDIPIRVGNICHLDVPDNYFSGYISLGVMEHRYEGQNRF